MLVGPWVCKRIGMVFCAADCQALGDIRDRKIIAGVVFNNFNGASIQMHVAVDDKRVSKSFVIACFRYAFEQAKVEKILGFVGSKNIAAYSLNRHLGFVKECKISGAHPDGYLVVMSMTRIQCRFLE